MFQCSTFKSSKERSCPMIGEQQHWKLPGGGSAFSQVSGKIESQLLILLQVIPCLSSPVLERRFGRTTLNPPAQHCCRLAYPSSAPFLFSTCADGTDTTVNQLIQNTTRSRWDAYNYSFLMSSLPFRLHVLSGNPCWDDLAHWT